MSGIIMAPNPWMLLPFGLLLGAIALAPLFVPDWWSRHYPKVALGLGGVTLGYYLLVLGAPDRVLQVAHDYVCFIMLVGSLFVVAGGIHIKVKGGATPLTNVVFLLAGALLANVLGTTGAAMLLVRPWIRMNHHRVAAHHIVFFIFIVANVGGCLTPIGDPPLFLGYLQGVPFWWVAEHCWPMWMTGVGILLAMFYVVDRLNYRQAPREIRRIETAPETWKFDGLANLLFLAVILGAVFIHQPVYLREGILLAAALGSYFTTDRSVHEANRFHFHPIQEVAVLFIGIFATMIPALDWLDLNARALLGAHPAPGVFYFGTGLLSGHAGQRADVSQFFERALWHEWREGNGGIIERERVESCGHQRRSGFFWRGHLHRQRAEFHGQGHGRPRKSPGPDVPGIYWKIHPAVPAADAIGGMGDFPSRLI